VSALWRRTVRFGFRLLYHELAFTYDAVSWAASMGAWRCWTETALRHLPSHDPILELAHGPGHLQGALAGQGRRVFGIDLSAQMGRQARRRLLSAGHPARLARANVQALPFADQSFAAVISTFPTEFITLPQTLGEVRRVLQPGAPLIVVPLASFSSGGAAAAGLEWAYRVTGQRTTPAAPETGIASYFAPHGFSVETFEEPCPRSKVLVIVARKTP
jgi:ubiquinone/menaquinone biosynthesis C-methylase UbiE